jgi:hypothetical protein
MTSRFKFFAGILLSGLLSVLCGSAHGQATYTASRLAEVQAFVGYTYTTPDYSYFKDSGVAFGADYIRYNRSRWTPALEFRANINDGPVINEHAYMGGLRVQTDFKGRYHPYVDFLAGLGIANYPLPTLPVSQANDHGLALSYGLGMDIDVGHNILLKADGQQQQWNLGPNVFTAPGKENFTLGPVVMTIGVAYRVPFGKWLSHGHETN